MGKDTIVIGLNVNQVSHWWWLYMWHLYKSNISMFLLAKLLYGAFNVNSSDNSNIKCLGFSYSETVKLALLFQSTP